MFVGEGLYGSFMQQRSQHESIIPAHYIGGHSYWTQLT